MPTPNRPAAARRIAARFSPVVGSDGTFAVATACVALVVLVPVDPLEPCDPLEPLGFEPDPELEPLGFEPDPELEPLPPGRELLDPCTTMVPCMNGWMVQM
jgi:hypothetical protein